MIQSIQIGVHFINVFNLQREFLKHAVLPGISLCELDLSIEVVFALRVKHSFETVI